MKTLLTGMFFLIGWTIVFAVFSNLTTCSASSKEEPMLEQPTLAAHLDYTFAYETMNTGYEMSYEVDGETIEPVMITITAADEATGLISGNFVYLSSAVPTVFTKCVTFAYYPETGGVWLFPHDGANPDAVLAYFDIVAEWQQKADLSFYPRVK